MSLGAWLRGNGIGLLLIIGLLVGAYLYFGEEWLWNVIKVALGLGFVIFIHELGHFAVAKWCDVYVETFSIGFGPPLPGCCFQRGETTYKIALFPLGGYVKMLGEGEGEGEGEEADDNPRSFKNKPVGQRMAIISAGVIMNLISGCLFFIWVYMAHGERRPGGVIGSVDPGSPAWQAGVRSDARILKVGDTQDPYFDDFKVTVMLAGVGERIPFAYTPADSPGQKIELELVPRREKHNTQPMIGIATAPDLRIVEKRTRFPAPTVPDSPAAKAQPPFKFGDLILGASDPTNPSQVTALRQEGDGLAQAHIRQREFRRRLEELAGKEMTFQVRRASAPATPEKPGEVVDIKVGPAYYHTLGLRMRMGQIAAVRRSSPAESAGVQLPDPDKNQDGDLIEQVEVTEADGTKLRYVATLSKEAPNGVVERELDPVRLPWELKQWASRTTGPRQVHLRVLRKTAAKGLQPVNLTLDWDEVRQSDREEPNHLQSPLSIPALGLAYRIETVVAGVEPKSPAAVKGIKEGDVIKAIRFQIPGDKPEEFTWPKKWQELKSDQWAFLAVTSQSAHSKTVGLKLARGKEEWEEELTAIPDLTWPRPERGMILDGIEHLQTAEGSFFKALQLGFNKTVRSIQTIYLSLHAMIFGQLSPTNIGGPIMIARVAYEFAGQGFYEFLLFLALISVNLAVVNFLPIPLLDGGHMVFLIYEKLRGKPASDRVLWGAMVAGIALIAAIFLFASYQDIMRLLF